MWIGVGPAPPAGSADHVLWLSDDPLARHDGRLVLAYHLLWELTHVCFEHPGLLTRRRRRRRRSASPAPTRAGWPRSSPRCRRRPPCAPRPGVENVDTTLVGPVRQATSCSSTPARRSHRRVADMTDFLYPFIEADERDAGPLLADLAALGRGQGGGERSRCGPRRSAALDASSSQRPAAMAERFPPAAGCSPSATAAAPPMPPAWPRCSPTRRRGRPLPARSLAADEAVLTALGNDVGFDLVFSRQLIAHAGPGDIALGLSTSGNSANLLARLRRGRRRGLLTVGLAGYDGGAMAASGDVDHCLVVRADSVHRIQETQAALVFELWAARPGRLRRCEAPAP